MIDPYHPRLPVVRQCTLVVISRFSYYYAGRGESSFNLQLMGCIDEQFLSTPWYGSRQMARHLRRQGHGVGRKRVRRLMRQMGLTTVSRNPSTSAPDGSHRIYPYRLGPLTIERPNQVGCADVTYIPMQRGFHLSGSDHGLGDAHGAVVAAVEHPGQCLLPGGLQEALARLTLLSGCPKNGVHLSLSWNARSDKILT